MQKYSVMQINITRLDTSQNFLPSLSGISWVISLCKLYHCYRNVKENKTPLTIDLPSETATFHWFRKCLAYLFLYLKAVIIWLLTRQLVLLHIINLSLPALSFAVWHSPRLLMSAKNKKLQWKSPREPPPTHVCHFHVFNSF